MVPETPTKAFQYMSEIIADPLVPGTLIEVCYTRMSKIASSMLANVVVFGSFNFAIDG